MKAEAARYQPCGSIIAAIAARAVLMDLGIHAPLIFTKLRAGMQEASRRPQSPLPAPNVPAVTPPSSSYHTTYQTNMEYGSHGCAAIILLAVIQISSLRTRRHTTDTAENTTFNRLLICQSHVNTQHAQKTTRSGLVTGRYGHILRYSTD